MTKDRAGPTPVRPSDGQEKTGAEIFVSGRVQGVGYRFFVEALALEFGLEGFCRNLSDGRVEIKVEGDRNHIEELVRRLRKGPPRADVTDLQVSYRPSGGEFSSFSIRY